MIGLLLKGSVTAPVPALVSHTGERTGVRFLEFFTADIAPLIREKVKQWKK